MLLCKRLNSMYVASHSLLKGIFIYKTVSTVNHFLDIAENPKLGYNILLMRFMDIP